MTLFLIEWVKQARLSLAGVTHSSLQVQAELRLILASIAGLPYEAIYQTPDHLLSPDMYHALEACISQRVQRRQPLQYILGEATFYGLILTVSPAVLIPRPETEHLVEAVCRWLRQRQAAQTRRKTPWRILDIGTGSGAIACAIQRQLGEIAIVTATDCSADALSIARQNAARHQLPIRFLQGSCTEPLESLPLTDRGFDVIVSNPPYIPDGEWEGLMPEVQQEPRLALTAGPDGLAVICPLLAKLSAYLNPEGAVWLELGDDQYPKVAQLAESTGHWQVMPPVTDYGGVDRIIRLNARNKSCRDDHPDTPDTPQNLPGGA